MKNYKKNTYEPTDKCSLALSINKPGFMTSPRNAICPLPFAPSTTKKSIKKRQV